MQPLQFPEAIRSRLTGIYRKRHREWLGGRVTWPLILALGAPTETDAQQHSELVRAWIAAWQNWQGSGELTWVERRWRVLGQQRLPRRLVLTRPEEIAAWTGDSNRWSMAKQRYERLVQRWPAMASGLSRHFDFLADTVDGDIERLEAMVAWLAANPRSGLYPRQVPVPGIHTKWLEHNRVVVSDMLRCLRSDSSPESDLFQLCGLKQLPRLMRLRILDADLRMQLGGLSDVTAPLTDLVSIPLKPTRVYIVENLQTGLAFGDLPGSVVLMRLGYAIDALAQLPWIAGAACGYWGDIDTHGFDILSRARACLPGLQSILMDERTLLSHRAFWVEEEQQYAAPELPYLHEPERVVYRGLKEQRWGLNVRFEQERVAWDVAESAIIRWSEAQVS